MRVKRVIAQSAWIPPKEPLRMLPTMDALRRSQRTWTSMIVNLRHRQVRSRQIRTQSPMAQRPSIRIKTTLWLWMYRTKTTMTSGFRGLQSRMHRVVRREAVRHRKRFRIVARQTRAREKRPEKPWYVRLVLSCCAALTRFVQCAECGGILAHSESCSKSLVCTSCKRTGHTSQVCFLRMGGNERD